MTKPTRPYIKLAALEAWLNGEGFTTSTVRLLLRDGTIPRTRLPNRTYSYYHVPAVAEALHIANPLTFSLTNPQLRPSLPPC
jgi:hypothetical protein